MPCRSIASNMNAGRAIGADRIILEVAVYMTAFLAANLEYPSDSPVSGLEISTPFLSSHYLIATLFANPPAMLATVPTITFRIRNLAPVA